MLKIGKIAYTNILPVFYFFREQEMAHIAEFIHKVPAELNQDLSRGNIDLGPVSSFEYANHVEQYIVLPDLSVSALGEVGSIFLFSKVPIEGLKEPKIALTSSSATSVNLLKIILEKFYDMVPKYTTMSPVLEKMMESNDAALLIGDDALSAKLKNTGYYIYDLGDLWYKQTGMWMTFALWTVRREVAIGKPGLLTEIYEEFLRSKKLGLANLKEIIHSVQKHFGGDFSFWDHYFSGLCYDFGPGQRKGLEYYYRCAAEIGLLEQPVQVALWRAGLGANLT
jgi:chorismate dehydratase